ncbi:sensor histidine kinase [Portibacter lacus]|uniref:sensor histidine kinase n=1 Tax=Portibacter lacus TaxID=1099794 RepID=UPI001F451A74|nr:histidine kinase [Portibacter lacus]
MLLEVGVVSLFLNAFNVLIGFILRSFTSWFTDIKEKEELGKKTELLELEMIKLKLDPHFLFNTINNIDVLIETDPEKASEYVFKLSSILRFYLYKASDSVINLSDELKYIHEYVELQKIRTSNLEFVNLTINGDPANKKIAPMVFIPFIENAFKHSLDKKTNAIVINIEILHDVVHFQCKNKKNLFIDEHSEAKGLGDSLIKNRLKLIYGDNYHINVNDSEKEYLVDLKIPV